jgi:hypothetical protein
VEPEDKNEWNEPKGQDQNGQVLVDILTNLDLKNSLHRKPKHAAIIGISKENSLLTILKKCLKLLTHEEDGKTEALAFYALANLPSHLDDIADPLSEKDFIETEPFKVLTNEDIIERH